MQMSIKLALMTICLSKALEIADSEQCFNDKWTGDNHGNCYKIESKKFNSDIEDAKKKCTDENSKSHLPYLKNKEVAQFFHDFIRKNNRNCNKWFLGASKQKDDWKWDDGTNITYWHKNKPNERSNDLMLSYNTESDKWVADSEHKACGVVCQMFGTIVSNTTTSNTTVNGTAKANTTEPSIIFTEWVPWGQCTATCGITAKIKIRRNCSASDKSLCGSLEHEVSCKEIYSSHPECPKDGSWSEWKAGSCSSTCGPGNKTLTRTCQDALFGGGCITIENGNTTIIPCQDKECPINGQWGNWSAWGECSVSCANATRARTRECNNPSPQHEGKHCPDNKTEVVRCDELYDKNQTDLVFLDSTYKRHCPIDGVWSNWFSNVNCSTTCGEGLKTFYRNCTKPLYNGRNCTGNNDTYSTKCNLVECPINGGWSEWFGTNQCSVTCGTGNSEEKRTCNQPAPQHGGADCVGESSRNSTCRRDQCPIHGQWSAWENTTCSVTCDFGYIISVRKCDNPPPKNKGALDCAGENTKEEYNCSVPTVRCPINGQWGSWISDANCSVTCDFPGKKKVYRECNNPKNDHGGDYCDGNNYKIENCWGNGTICPPTVSKNDISLLISMPFMTMFGLAILCVCIRIYKTKPVNKNLVATSNTDASSVNTEDNTANETHAHEDAKDE